MRIHISLLMLALLAAPAAAQQTTAERTGYRETSSYDDVMSFLDSLQRTGAGIRVGVLGTSPEGRSIPYAVAARPMVADPAEARGTGKPIIYVQANIHAGEVEGKEALQMLLRDLTLGPLQPLLDSVVLLAVPIYNIDGNEAWAPGEVNRPGQNGPPVVGRRQNGQGFDLNRDYVKLEAPETRGSLALIDRWEPDIFIDLHTTNGSYHGYDLTYSPGLNANDTPSNAFIRERFLPEIRERMRERHGQETFSYGNFLNQDPDSLILGWRTYEGFPRYGTNWFALRGGMAILSEAYSNDPFEERVSATYNFVREILSLAAARRDTIQTLHALTDRQIPDSVIVRAELAPPTEQPVIAEITEPAGDGSGGYARRKRTGVYRTIRMPVYEGFAAERTEALPEAYLVPPQYRRLVDLLRANGVVVDQLADGWSGRVESFTVDSVVAADRVFQGHRLVRVEGAWQAAEGHEIPAGWYLVRTGQPTGLLAAYLLEPASEDGFVTWNLLDRDLRPRTAYPILRVREPVAAETVVVP